MSCHDDVENVVNAPVVTDVIMTICFAGHSFVPVLGEQPAASEPDGQGRAGDWGWDWLALNSGKSTW